MYEQISANKWKSVLMVFVFFAFVIGIGYLIGRVWGGHNGPYIGLGFAFIIALVIGLVSYYRSDKVALRISGARPLAEGEHVTYRNAVEGLAIAAGIPTPQIYVIEDNSMNAFATGRDPKHASVAATTGLLERVNTQQLEGVMGHEISHVKNYDILLMTLTVVLVGTVILLSDVFLRTFWFRDEGGGGDSGEAGLILLIIGIVMAILAPIIAQLIRLAISRRREYLADANGALLTRYPTGLREALEVLSGDQRQYKRANKATAHLFIIQPLKTGKGQRGSWFNRMFDTHPPIEDRIERLREMEGSFVPEQAPQGQ